VVVVAGEASGDQHAACLVHALRGLEPGLMVSGIGGSAMASAGVELLFRSENLALVGISEVLGKLGHIWRALSGIKAHLRRSRPDLVILVDFPDFNFRVATAAKKLGLKVLYYISPQVWAWRQKRVHKLVRLVDHLAVVFTSEADFYRDRAPSLPVTFVGHPLLDEIKDSGGNGNEALPVPAGAEVVGLLPGSRISEITRLAPLLLEAAAIMRRERSGLHFVLPVAPGLDRQSLDPYLTGAQGLTVVLGRALQVMSQARLILVASGTATLQAALAGVPMVVVYKTGWFNYALGKRLIKVEHIALPNIIAGRSLLPELIQARATPEAVARVGLGLLADDVARAAMASGLAEVRAKLGGPGVSRRAAELAQRMIRKGGS
jgi:lipid-A-disaccharide synthase